MLTNAVDDEIFGSRFMDRNTGLPTHPGPEKVSRLHPDGNNRTTFENTAKNFPPVKKLATTIQSELKILIPAGSTRLYFPPMPGDFQVRMFDLNQ